MTRARAPKLTRRRFVGSLGAGAALLLLPRCPAALPQRRGPLRLKPFARADLYAPHAWAG